MSYATARAIADETIAYWRRLGRTTACGVYRQITGQQYPGGGWERTRAAMVDWLVASGVGAD